MIKLDIGRIPDGHSHHDLETDVSGLEAHLEDGRLESPVSLSLDVDRRGGDIFIRGTAKTRAVLGCSRCLNEYSLEIETSLDVWCIIGGERDDDDEGDRDNVIRVPPGAGSVDLAGPVRSELLVLLPLKPLCDEDCRGALPQVRN